MGSTETRTEARITDPAAMLAGLSELRRVTLTR
jgi:hypothetical protein